ncbi:MAG: magnesium/cobalt transporter CorA [bacterium]|nr:magnesium/cobalt transporter CorA [bacterium]
MQYFARNRKKGLPPGSLVYVGPQHSRPPVIHVIDYDRDRFSQREATLPDEDIGVRSAGQVRWIRVQGVHDKDVVENVCRSFNIHAMTMEDILHTWQRSKLEEFDHYTFLEMDHLEYDPAAGMLRSAQVAVVIGAGFVISFEEAAAQIFQTIVQRLETKKGRVRNEGSHYLAYALLDVLVDHYFVAADALLEHVLSAEQRLLSGDSPEILESIYGLRRTATEFRSKLLPATDIAARMRKEDIFGAENQVYIRELSDHILTAIENVRGINEVVNDMLNLFLSRATYRMNEIMKTLTIVGAIFIPLTFVVGIFGMNFDYMPELKLAWAYPATLLGLAGIAGLMLLYFRRKGWI